MSKIFTKQKCKNKTFIFILDKEMETNIPLPVLLNASSLMLNPCSRRLATTCWFADAKSRLLLVAFIMKSAITLPGLLKT